MIIGSRVHGHGMMSSELSEHGTNAGLGKTQVTHKADRKHAFET